MLYKVHVRYMTEAYNIYTKGQQTQFLRKARLGWESAFCLISRYITAEIDIMIIK